MQRAFPEILSALRHERQLSQRSAASALGISQALLSHYENGAREPGLAFVCRACDYYGVSADYLLGRSDSPNPARSAAETAQGFLDRMQTLLLDAGSALAQYAQEEGKA